jgi:hypothetical protein
MRDPAKDPRPAPAEVPGWLDDATKRLMVHARDAALAAGRGACGATDAAREVLLCHRPALPFAMIEEAVAALVGAPAGVPGAALNREGETVRGNVRGSGLTASPLTI